MATVTIAVPTDKWDTIARIAALEGMGVAAWLEDFVAQQVRIVLESARQELDMDEPQFCEYLGSLDARGKDHRQAVMDAFIDEIMETYDFDGLLAMHERVFS